MNHVIQPVARIRGGARAPHYKDTAEAASVVMPSPELVIIPMQQHIGAPCKPTVKPGDTVLAGQVIGDTDAFVSAPIHSSVSGKVKSIGPVQMSNGSKCDAVYIESDGEDNYIDANPVDVKNKSDLLAATRASGLVGIGGAGFPTHAKLAIKDNVKVDTLLINGAECEPYITSDYREIMEFPERIIAGTELVMEHLDIPRGIIGIESNKPKGVETLKKYLAEINPEGNIDIMELPAMYPHGAEKMLIYAATGRQVPVGGLPADIGCIVLNITSVAFIHRYVKTGLPLTQKRLTVSGGAIKEHKNVIAPIGSKVSDILGFCGGFTAEPTRLIFGGPMMGIAQYDTDMPITKQNNAIIGLTAAETITDPEQPCIRCGRCVDACPMSLLPVSIEWSLRSSNAEAIEKLNAVNCMECGCCAFACPSVRPLTQYMRDAKNLLKRKSVAK